MNQPWVYMYPPSWTPPPNLPPHPIPQGCPSTLALSALFHALNLDWCSISHMVIYMFQCYSLKSSHPCLFPQSPKVCSLYLCLFCYITYRVIVTIFLNSIRSDQSLSCVWLFATPWIAARQASLSITNPQSSLKLMSIKLAMPSSHLILRHPLLLLPSIFPSLPKSGFKF